MNLSNEVTFTTTKCKSKLKEGKERYQGQLRHHVTPDGGMRITGTYQSEPYSAVDEIAADGERLVASTGVALDGAIEYFQLLISPHSVMQYFFSKLRLHPIGARGNLV